MKQARTRGKRMRRGLRIYITVLLALAILGGAGYQVLRVQLLKNAQDLGTALARSYAAEERNNLTVYETLMVSGAQNISQWEGEDLSDEQIRTRISRYFLQLMTLLGESTIDPYAVFRGEIVAANPWEGDADFDYAEAEWYQAALAAEGGKPVFTDVYTDAITQKPVITIAQRCGDSETVLAFDVFPENFRFSSSQLSLPENSSFILCDANGNFIYREPVLTDYTYEEVNQYAHTLVEQIQDGTHDSYASSITDPAGTRRNVYYAYMPNGWYSIITIPYDFILDGLTQFTTVFLLLFLACALSILFISWRDLRLNAQVERTNETVRVLGNSYYALYRVDYRKKTYEMIKGSDYVRGKLGAYGAYDDLLQAIGEVIEPDAYQEFNRSFSAESIHKLVSKRVRDFGGDFQRKFGDTYRWVNVRVLFDESLAPDEVVLCFREVEQEKQRQFQERKLLEAALENSRRSERAKQSFFSNMSHDMRTPLNAILGLTQLARGHLDDPEQTGSYLEKIYYSSRQLLDLVNDILDMSRMEQGKVVLNAQQFNLLSCLRECTEPFRLQAEAEKKNFTLQFDVQTPTIMGDAMRISQILNNLLSNAFKFTKAGDSITVEVRQFETKDCSQFQFTIKDTGLGMSEEFLPQLFEPYARETRFTSRQISGTGLGMPIVKNLVTQMSGQIQVDSKLGEGTTFTVTVPLTVVKEELTAPELESAPARPIFSLEGKRILLAEDNMINMEIATEILTMNGITVVQAWNGQEALDLFKAAEPFSFDAILMDMQMPQMDGCEAARNIRALPRPDAKSVPIIAVTANAFAEDIAKTMAAGMDAHISKPIDFKILCQTIEKLTTHGE